MTAFEFLITSLRYEILTIRFFANCSKCWFCILVDLLYFPCTKSASICSFSLLPFFASVSTVIRLNFAFLAKVFATLVASNSLECIMSCGLLSHRFSFIILYIQINLSWLNTHLILTILIGASDWLIHISNELLI